MLEKTFLIGLIHRARIQGLVLTKKLEYRPFIHQKGDLLMLLIVFILEKLVARSRERKEEESINLGGKERRDTVLEL